jgi:hypothetical protein
MRDKEYVMKVIMKMVNDGPDKLQASILTTFYITKFILPLQFATEVKLPTSLCQKLTFDSNSIHKSFFVVTYLYNYIKWSINNHKQLFPVPSCQKTSVESL